MGLSKNTRIAGRTAPQVAGGFDVALARLAASGLRFRGRKLGAEGLLGAVVLDFLAQPPEVQEQILTARLPELEGLIANPEATLPNTPRSPYEPVAIRKRTPSAPDPNPDDQRPDPKPAPARRRRKGTDQ